MYATVVTVVLCPWCWPCLIALKLYVVFSTCWLPNHIQFPSASPCNPPFGGSAKSSCAGGMG